MNDMRLEARGRIGFRQLGPHKTAPSATPYRRRVRTDLSIPVDAAVLAATVSRPAGEHPPGLVAVHGADAGERGWYLYEHLHRVLPPAGIAVVTFDRRGDGASTGEPSRGRFEQQAEDALAVIDHVAREAELDPERIGLWGISQGGWVAPLAATMSPRVAVLVLLASCGVTPGEQMRWTAGFQTRREFGDEAGAEAEHLWELALDWMRGGEREPVEAAVAEARTKPWWRTAWFPEEAPGDEVRDEVRAELDFDPVPVFARVRVPTLLVYGDEDEWIPVDESLAAWRKARGEEIDILLVQGTGHEPAHGEELSQEYEESLVTWLRARFGLTKA
jgi:dipeptidyl aminopeptidase/acylaminoacyl peptidase